MADCLPPSRPCPGPSQPPKSRTPCRCSTPSPGPGAALWNRKQHSSCGPPKLLTHKGLTGNFLARYVRTTGSIQAHRKTRHHKWCPRLSVYYKKQPSNGSFNMPTWKQWLKHCENLGFTLKKKIYQDRGKIFLKGGMLKTVLIFNLLHFVSALLFSKPFIRCGVEILIMDRLSV